MKYYLRYSPLAKEFSILNEGRYLGGIRTQYAGSKVFLSLRIDSNDNVLEIGRIIELFQSNDIRRPAKNKCKCGSQILTYFCDNLWGYPSSSVFTLYVSCLERPLGCIPLMATNLTTTIHDLRRKSEELNSQLEY